MYFAGLDTRGDPVWTNSEPLAATLFSPPGPACMGELSVTFNRYLQKWLMLYNCDSPRGINFRVSEAPWGPWSPPRVLFDPGLISDGGDGGYCQSMHYQNGSACPPGSPNPSDNLVIGGPNRWGGEYGPYVVDQLTVGDEAAKRTTIFFTMSTWNPYQVVLMKSTLQQW